MPFAPSNDTMTTASLADVCGVSGIGSGGIYDACNFYAPACERRQGSGVHAVHDAARAATTPTGTTSRPNFGVAWRPNVQSGWLRALLGDPEQATMRGGYSEAFERQGIGGFTGIYGPNPGSTLSLTRNANTGLVGPGETLAGAAARDRAACTRRRFLSHRRSRLRFGRIAPTTSTPFIPTSRSPSARSWTVGLQRARHQQHGASRSRYVGTRGVNQWSTLNYNERNVIENGFLDEFKLAMTNLRPITRPAAPAADRSPTSARAAAPIRCRFISPI